MIVIGLIIGGALGFFFAALLYEAKVTDLEFENQMLKESMKRIRNHLFGEQ